MTLGNAVVSSHEHYRAFAIGGSLIDGSPGVSKTIGGHSLVAIPPSAANGHSGFNFAAGVTYGQSLPFAWTHFEHLARTIQPSENVHVLCHGGRVDLSTLFGNVQMGGQPGYAQARGYNTLIVFNTVSQVILGPTHDGRQLFASILAPFSHVRVESNVGFIDGFVIARTLDMDRRGSAVQIHGHCFAHGLACGVLSQCQASAPPTSSCLDIFATRKCFRKRRKGKCRKRRIQRNCAATCGAC
jgi:hypothetical protein